MTPMGALPEHSSLLRLARIMLELLLLGDFALQRLHELEATVHDGLSKSNLTDLRRLMMV